MADKFSDKLLDKIGKASEMFDRAKAGSYSTAKRAARRADQFIGEHLSGEAMVNKAKKKNLMATPEEFKKGGKVKKTGMALVHKGEKVLTKKQANKPAIKKALKKGNKK